MLSRILLALLIVGGLNWGSIGLFGFDFVGAIFGGQGALVSRIIFVIVGVSAIWSCSFFRRDDRIEHRV